MSVAVPHPRETFDRHGGEAAEAAFLESLERGRLHHAWLLVGPEGVGKATFAYRAARRLLGATPDASLGALGAAPDHAVSRQIIARAHPDLLVLERETPDGKPRKGIPVEEARGLPEFFAKSPASAPYRVAIIDAADDLAPSAANAVLKTLEEPPERGVLLLVSPSPGSLLPTLRSRCRRLRFATPPPAPAAAWVAAKAGVEIAEAERLLVMARGAPGLAWRLAGADALAMDDAARAILETLTAPDESALQAIADGFRGAAGAARFNLLFDRLAERVRANASEAAVAGGGEGTALDGWAQSWSMLNDLAQRTEAVNLDRSDVFFTAVGRLRAVAGATAC